MDIKSKKFNKTLYYSCFWVCVVSLLACLSGAMLFSEYFDRTGEMYDWNMWLLFFPNNYSGEYYANSWGTYGAELALIRKYAINFALMAMAGGLLTVITFIATIIQCGEPDEKGGLITAKIDKLWTEIQIVLLCMAIGFGGTGFMSILYNGLKAGKIGGYPSQWVQEGYTDYLYYQTPLQISASASVAVGFISAWLGLWMIVSMVRKLKAHAFIKNSLFGMIIWEPVKNLYRGGSLMRRVAIIAAVFCLASATVFLAPVVLILILVFAPRWINKYEAVKKGVSEVKNGNLKYQIPVPEGANGELDILARDINKISEASNIAVQNELKNQRMKTELISNVSHDLKTPLTSMVTYIDLLKNEGLDSENAPEYLDILERKTQRLRQLTEDLFEAAKASSGAMPVNMEKIDLLSILNQSMGEMDQKIKESGLEFIVNAPKEKCCVKADGQLLWRVIDNLIGNTLKYAQENSRVYIDIRTPVLSFADAGDAANQAMAGSADMAKGSCGSDRTATDTNVRNGFAGVKNIGKWIKDGFPRNEADSNTHVRPAEGIAVLEIKNMSKQALNMDASELMERFKRGDESRTTEGSGLGLAIAKDLVKLMGGWLEITIDGDLFKAQVMLNKCE